MWAYKYGSIQPATSAHADFAATNVNFWLTPDEANLDPTSGGMIIYDAEASMSWDFNSYNKQGGKIARFLREQSAQAITVPVPSESRDNLQFGHVSCDAASTVPRSI
jgi:hypothetical protein